MGRRGGKFKKHSEGIQGSKKVKVEWNCPSIPEDHPLFREYYAKQLNLENQDFALFWAAMKEKLPVVFRVNPNCPNHQAFCHKIQSPNFISSIIPHHILDQLNKTATASQPAEQTSLISQK
jgi:hypothetical protein